jgi:two-component sensor histidine kinase
MRLDCAIPCGLILNELLTNAFKYAFPNGQPRAGEKACAITIAAAWNGGSVDEGVYSLTVSDNGVGLPVDLDWATSKTLGLRLVRMLGQYQLNGRVELDRSQGTSFRLVFASRQREEG